MATITKTFTETEAWLPKKKWTISVTGTNQTVSNDFTITTPTVKAKVELASSVTGYTPLNKGTASVYLHYNIGTNRSCGFRRNDGGGYISFVNGTTYSLTPYNNFNSVSLSDVFNEDNKTSLTVNITATSQKNEILLSSNNKENSSGYEYANGYSNTGSVVSWGTIATITLDAPPIVTLGTPTYSTPHYTGFGSYSVPITSADAQYDGDITKVTLSVGQDKTEQTYSAASISDETISVIPTIAGTYTPTLTVTDSRGQTTTQTLTQITVNQYNAPSLDFNVFRSNSSGVKDDEGAYGLVTANISFTDAVADITEPTVQINGTTTSSVTWYSAYNASTGVSSAISDWSTVSDGDTIYGLINGSFSQTDSYQITITLEDSLGGTSSAITQTLSTAFYTIDFQAGGKEIVFGGPAKDDLTNYPNGLFKCEMDIIGRGFLDYFYPIGSYYETSDTTFNPNTKWGGTWVLETEGMVHIGGSPSGTYQVSGATTDTKDGGDATHKHTTGNFTLGTTHIPAHTHGQKSLSGTFTIRRYINNSYGTIFAQSGIVTKSATSSATAATPTGQNSTTSVYGDIMKIDATHTHDSVGGGNAHNHGDTGSSSTMQPYIVVNRWHRTA